MPEDCSVAPASRICSRIGYSPSVMGALPRINPTPPPSNRLISARNPELESVVAASLDDPASYLVYADWLTSQGDPRGELIVVQHRLSRQPDQALSARERELLAALSQGSSNAKLAADFHISVQTVKFHLKNVYGKLGTANRAQAAALYVSAID